MTYHPMRLLFIGRPRRARGRGRESAMKRLWPWYWALVRWSNCT